MAAPHPPWPIATLASLHTHASNNLQVKFVLDFGPVLGGKFTAKPVAGFLDPFLRDTMANMVVWPQR
jgi:hypothetical protein